LLVRIWLNFCWQKIKVAGIVREKDNPNITHIEDKLELFLADLQNENQIKKILKKVKVDFILHLAGAPSPRISFVDPQTPFKVNVGGLLNVLQAVTEIGIKPRILVIGSAEEYGLVEKNNLPVTEEVPLQPVSPYAVSKIAADFLGLVYFRSHNLQIVRLRPFNHIGPRQEPIFSVASFAQQIAKIEAGVQKPVIKVGNLTAKRDFTDVRDMVLAYFLAAEKGIAGEVYNVGSGKSYKLAKILEILLSFSKIKVKIKKDPKRFQQFDLLDIYCDHSKFTKLTGWQPKYKIEETLFWTLSYWRKIV